MFFILDVNIIEHKKKLIDSKKQKLKVNNF